MIKKIRKSLNYIQVLTSERADLRVIQVNTAELLLEAQQLHAKVYLDRGFIEAHQVTGFGVMSRIHDPYQDHSQYFVVEATHPDGTRRIVGTARAILATESKGHKSFPTMAKLKISPQAKAELLAIPHSDFLEVSALAKARGVGAYPALMLYRAIWQYAIRENRRIVIMACDASVFSHLKFLFGKALRQIGDRTFYMGSFVIPATLAVQESLAIAVGESKGWNPIQREFKRRLVHFFLKGLPENQLTLTSKYIDKKSGDRATKPPVHP